MPNPYKITEFSKTHYDQLIGYLASNADVINKDPQALGPTANLRLDETLSSTLRAGSQEWAVAKNFSAAAGTFGASAHTQYVVAEQEARTFSDHLKSAEDVFENTDDLASYAASKFEQNYPGITSPSSTTT